MAARERERGSSSDSLLSRWEQLLQDRDDRRVWQTSTWKGSLSDSVQIDDKPFDEEFQHYYANLMKVFTPDLADECRDAQVTVPLLNDPISAAVSAQITKINRNKACG